MKTAFCEECREDVEYTIIEDKTVFKSLCGVECIYDEKEAYCNKCGNRLYVAELIDSNLKALYKEFRRTKENK